MFKDKDDFDLVIIYSAYVDMYDVYLKGVR